MKGSQSPAYCSHCGQSLLPESRFCSSCGKKTVSSSATAERRTRLLRVGVPVWIVILLLAFAGSFAHGWLSSANATMVLPTPDQSEALGRYGRPMAFWLTDGPGTPGGTDDVRTEQWFYPATGLILTFVDGSLTSTMELTFTEQFAGTPIAPHELSSSMDPAAVAELLGEDGTPVDADAAGYPEYAAYVYPSARLAIGFSKDHLLTAQTY